MTVSVEIRMSPPNTVAKPYYYPACAEFTGLHISSSDPVKLATALAATMGLIIQRRIDKGCDPFTGQKSG